MSYSEGRMNTPPTRTPPPVQVPPPPAPRDRIRVGDIVYVRAQVTAHVPSDQLTDESFEIQPVDAKLRPITAGIYSYLTPEQMITTSEMRHLIERKP
jgi:hypothetical protein